MRSGPCIGFPADIDSRVICEPFIGANPSI